MKLKVVRDRYYRVLDESEVDFTEEVYEDFKAYYTKELEWYETRVKEGDTRYDKSAKRIEDMLALSYDEFLSNCKDEGFYNDEIIDFLYESGEYDNFEPADSEFDYSDYNMEVTE